VPYEAQKARGFSRWGTLVQQACFCEMQFPVQIQEGESNSIPQRLKPTMNCVLVARLKSCPSRAWDMSGMGLMFTRHILL
jgi:hypothetical protein